MFTDEDWETINTLCSVWQTSIEAWVWVEMVIEHYGPPLIVKWAVHCTLDGVQFSSWKTRFQTYTRKTKLSPKKLSKNSKNLSLKTTLMLLVIFTFCKAFNQMEARTKEGCP
jgi:hypothetical protein